MPCFPVSSSILSTSHLASFINEKYALGNETECRILRAGINHTYLVNSRSGKFIFRIYSLNWRTLTEINEEINLLNLLKENQISVSAAIADRENNYVQILNAPEGDRFAVLFTYARGEKLHQFSPDAHAQIGELMARLHRVTENKKLDRVTYTPQVLLVDSLVKLNQFLPSDTAEMKFMEATQKRLLHDFENANTQKLRYGIAHLDIWFENLNITESNEVTLFDFDFCGNGWLSLDIAFYIMQVYSIEREEKECKIKVDRFLQGYESVSPINEEEKRLIPQLGLSLYFFYLGIQCERFDNWSNSFLNESYLKRYINALVKRYYDLTISVNETKAE